MGVPPALPCEGEPRLEPGRPRGGVGPRWGLPGQGCAFPASAVTAWASPRPAARLLQPGPNQGRRGGFEVQFLGVEPTAGGKAMGRGSGRRRAVGVPHSGRARSPMTPSGGAWGSEAGGDPAVPGAPFPRTCQGHGLQFRGCCASLTPSSRPCAGSPCRMPAFGCQGGDGENRPSRYLACFNKTFL